MSGPTIGLSPQAQAYFGEIERRRLDVLKQIRLEPIAALIWGPAPTSDAPVAKARRDLKHRLVEEGHLAFFSEDHVDSSSDISVQGQELAHAAAADIVFSLPDSFGSLAEIHDFAKIPWLSSKIVTFIDCSHDSGYANQSLVQIESIATCRIVTYDAARLPDCIIDEALRQIRRLQEVKFMLRSRFA